MSESKEYKESLEVYLLQQDLHIKTLEGNTKENDFNIDSMNKQIDLLTQSSLLNSDQIRLSKASIKRTKEDIKKL